MWVIDSTPVECGRSRETAHRCRPGRTCRVRLLRLALTLLLGLRLHLVATLHGLPVGFALTGAKADERQVLLSVLGADYPAT